MNKEEFEERFGGKFGGPILEYRKIDHKVTVICGWFEISELKDGKWLSGFHLFEVETIEGHETDKGNTVTRVRLKYNPE